MKNFFKVVQTFVVLNASINMRRFFTTSTVADNVLNLFNFIGLASHADDNDVNSTLNTVLDVELITL